MDRRLFLKMFGAVELLPFPAFATDDVNVSANHENDRSLSSNNVEHSLKKTEIGDTTDDDIMNDFRSLVLFGLGEIPFVGGVFSVLLGLLWGTKSVWDQIKKQVEAMIHAEIDTAIFNLVQTFTNGLGQVLKTYEAARKAQLSPEVLSENFVAAHMIFVDQMEVFTDHGEEQKLLPLFMIAASMHLILLRLGTVSYKEMNWSDNTVKFYKMALKDAIEKYTAHANKQLKNIEKDRDSWLNQYSNSINGVKYYIKNHYRNYINYYITDLLVQFPYFDAEKYPNGFTSLLKRVLYSPPVGANTSDYTPSADIDNFNYEEMSKQIPGFPYSFSLYDGPGRNDITENAIVGFATRYPNGQQHFYGRFNPKTDGNHYFYNKSKGTGKPRAAKLGFFRAAESSWGKFDIWSINDIIANGGNYVHTLDICTLSEDYSVKAGQWGTLSGNFRIPGHLIVDLVDVKNSAVWGFMELMVAGYQLINYGHSADPKTMIENLFIYGDQPLENIVDIVEMHERNLKNLLEENYIGSANQEDMQLISDINFSTLEEQRELWQISLQQYLSV